MHKITLTAIAVISGIIIVVSPFINTSDTKAISGSDFKPGRIIDDFIFTNKDTMSIAQIQQFLNAKVPVCEVWHSAYNSSNPPPYTCLKDYQENPTNGDNNFGRYVGSSPYQVPGGKSAAQIIWEAGQTYGINPQVLIVLLQKEQGLVTDSWPLISQYTKAMGYLCPDTAPCSTSAGGFYKQVFGAAWQFRNDFNGIDTPGFWSAYGKGWNNIYYNPSTSCGTRSVYIETQATAVLYKYTPYTPNDAALAVMNDSSAGGTVPCGAYGNRNFFWYFNKWFGNSMGSFLVRTPSSPTYYLLTNGKKFAIPNGDILYAYGIQSQPLEIVSDQYLSSIIDGGLLSTLFTVPNDTTVYLADGSKKFGIASGDYCIKWGLACGNTQAQKEIGTEMLFRMSDGGVLQPIMKYHGQYYLMENGSKKQFLSEKAIINRGLSSTSSSEVINWTNIIRPYGYSLPEYDSFVKFANSNAIYVYTQDGFYNIPSNEMFRDWFTLATPLHLDNYSQYNTIPPQTIGSLSGIISTPNGNKYLIDEGRKINITPTQADWPVGAPVGSLSVLADRLPINATTSSQSTFRQKDGGIYKVISQKKQPFNSPRDYFDLGYNSSNIIQLSNSEIPLPIGNTLFAEGSAYKVQGSDAIFRVGLNSKANPFQSLRQVWDYKTNPIIPTITAANASQFSVDISIKSLIKSSLGQIFIVNESGKIPMSNDDVNNWGINTSLAMELGNISLGRIQTLSIVPVFLSSPNGTIFIGENGSKRPIANFEAYKRLGGNASNTALATQEVLDTIPTGIIIQ